MRFVRVVRALATGSSVIGSISCGADGATSPDGTPVLVTFINVTHATTMLRIEARGYTDIGGARYCLNVDPAKPDVSIRVSATDAPVTGFTPSFEPGGRYTVFIKRNVNGTFEFTTVANTFTPAAGKLGVRLFNAASVPLDLFAYGLGETILPTDMSLRLSGVQPGTVSGYTEIPDGPHSFQAALVTLWIPVYSWGSREYPTRANITLLAAPPGDPFAVEECTLPSFRRAS